MQTPIIFIEISVRSQGRLASANPTRAYRNETIQLSIGEKKSEAKRPFAFLSSSFLSHPSHFTGNVLCSIVLHFFAVFALSLSPEYPKEAPVATS
jgi:hypothetical protein